MFVLHNDHHDLVLSKAAQKDHREPELLDPSSASTLDVTAFVSCYNEVAFIRQTLDDVCQALHRLQLNFEIIVIDDCSRDGSFDLVRSYIDEHPAERIILRRNRVNKGLAQNYIDAAFLGKGRYYKLFCGDNTEPPDSIVRIFQSLGKADMLIVNYSDVVGKSAFRNWVSNSFTFMVNQASGNKIKYYNGLAVHRRYNVMRWHPNTRGFGFQADIICRLIDQGATYLEISVPAVNRSASGALSIKNILSVGHTFLDILIRRIANKVYRRRTSHSATAIQFHPQHILPARGKAA
jgi:glycosyltransferase involved in cell wall biosynthesis